jgi:hypothetical protein
MKQALTILIAVLLFTGANAQTLQASIGQGDITSKVRIFVKSSAAVATTNISTLQFNVAIPDAVNPKPTIVIIPNTTNFPGVTWQVNTASEGGFYNYKITTPTAPIQVTSLNTTNEVAVMDVEFQGGSGTSNVTLLTLNNGGSDGNFLFLATGTPASNSSTSNTPPGLYFSRSGTTVTNTDSYNGGGNSTAVVGNILLPVKFLSFYALKNDDNAKLNWTVEGDEDNKYFEVERSTDGRVFKPLSKINAMGNGRSVNTYEAVDQRLSGLGAATVYYRIKQTDINGNIVYSSIKNLNATRKSTPVQILPNPAKSTTKLVFDADNAGKGTILVRDMQGKLVLQYNTTLVKGINQQEMNVSSLASGDYNVTVSGDGFTHLVKLSKIN